MIWFSSSICIETRQKPWPQHCYFSPVVYKLVYRGLKITVMRILHDLPSIYCEDIGVILLSRLYQDELRCFCPYFLVPDCSWDVFEIKVLKLCIHGNSTVTYVYYMSLEVGGLSTILSTFYCFGTRSSTLLWCCDKQFGFKLYYVSRCVGMVLNLFDLWSSIRFTKCEGGMR